LDHFSAHPSTSYPHFISLLGIAVKAICQDDFPILVADLPGDCRLTVLEQLLIDNRNRVREILRTRRNSFTGARRFLVPQVLLSAYFAGSRYTVRFADLGTGLGIVPRQLNSRVLYDRFSVDLKWPEGFPKFRRIPLATRFGVDRAPMPDLDWVTACYGSSSYYRTLHHELLYSLAVPEVRFARVSYEALDLTDTTALSEFMSRNQINAVNLCYSLYELNPNCRTRVIHTLVECLEEPRVVIVTEPSRELAEPGCTVYLYEKGSTRPLGVCRVSDGHFKGSVTPLDGYGEFCEKYGIIFRDATEVA
jgi:hypothetical protein